jgi:hypothetical protein
MLKKINRQMEKLLEQSSQPVPHINEPALSATLKRDSLIEDNLALSHISYVFSEGISNENITILFDKISHHFEGAWLCRKNSTAHSFSVTQACFFAKPLEKKQAEQSVFKHPLPLPRADLMSILKIPAHQLLKKSGLMEQLTEGHLDPDGKMQAYVITLGINHKLILFSSLAEPWAHIKIETLQKALLRIQFNL